MPMTPQQVTAFLEQVGDELEALEAARAEVAQLQDEMRQLREERDELVERLEATTDPIVAVGLEVENVLRATRQLADEVHERARLRAADLVAEAAEAASAALAASQQLRTGAEMDAAEIISQAWRQGADMVARQAAWYEELLTAEREKVAPRADVPTTSTSPNDHVASIADVLARRDPTSTHDDHPDAVRAGPSSRAPGRRSRSKGSTPCCCRAVEE